MKTFLSLRYKILESIYNFWTYYSKTCFQMLTLLLYNNILKNTNPVLIASYVGISQKLQFSLIMPGFIIMVSYGNKRNL